VVERAGDDGGQVMSVSNAPQPPTQTQKFAGLEQFITATSPRQLHQVDSMKRDTDVSTASEFHPRVAESCNGTGETPAREDCDSVTKDTVRATI
jgi:hypothetical protein